MKTPKARKLPSGTWRIQLRLGGESINVNARTEKECVRLAQITKAEYLAGKRQAPLESEPEAEKLPTLRDAIDGYISGRKNALSPSTVRGYQTIRDTRFGTLMDRSLSDITDKEWIDTCQNEAKLCAPKTLKNAWAFLRSVCKYSTGQDLPECRLPQIAPNDSTFLDADQIKIFIPAVHGDPCEIPFLLALSSLRRSELLALRWENVDLKHHRILVKGAAVYGPDQKLVQKPTNKNRSSTRWVPILIPELEAALASVKQPEGLVVTRSADNIRVRLQQICRDNNLPVLTIHGLRHSFASLAYHLGVPEKITMEIGGWSDDRTMRKIYTHIAQSDMTRYETVFRGFFEKNAHKNAHTS